MSFSETTLPADFLAAVSPESVPLRRSDLRAMIALVRVLNRLAANSAYREAIAPLLPESARFDPGYSAVMMGYDFHLSEAGPRLIEVNTNAGGGLLALLSGRGQMHMTSDLLAPPQRGKLLGSFLDDFRAFRRDPSARPGFIAIIDETPEEQFLYPEMQAFVELFRSSGIEAEIFTPEQLSCDADGVVHNGRRIEMIYNRHCDFYLQNQELAGLRAAYLAGQVCLTPNPWLYGLLGDKRRLALYTDARRLVEIGVPQQDISLLSHVVPNSRLLADCDPNETWSNRKELVFKPLSLFASRGVLLGKSISRKRFDALPPEQTLVQEFVPPSQISVNEDTAMKADFRLFTYRDRILCAAARLYQGQVTNMRTPGGGFAAVRLID